MPPSLHSSDALLAANPVIADFAKIVDFPNEEAWQDHLNCLIPIVGKDDKNDKGDPQSPL